MATRFASVKRGFGSDDLTLVEAPSSSKKYVRRPVVVAPGAMGSDLWRGNEQLWPNVKPNLKPVDPGNHFPEGVAKIYALIPFNGAIRGEQWRYERYLDGKVLEKMGGTGWDVADSGTIWVGTWNADGLTPGDWELRLYVADQVVQKSTFTIERTKPGTASFGMIRFAEGIQGDKPANPHQPVDDFKAGTTQVYAFFDAANMTKQTNWESVWSRDGNPIEGAGETRTWTGNPSEKDWYLRIFDDKGLAPVTYEVKLYIEDRLAQLGTFVISQ